MVDVARLSRFALVGALATLIYAVVLAVPVEMLGATPLQASIPAFIAAALFSYSAHRGWTFAAPGRHGTQFARFTLVALGGLGINLLITYLTVQVLRWGYGTALILVVLVVPFMSFFLNRDWTFKKRGAV